MRACALSARAHTQSCPKGLPQVPAAPPHCAGGMRPRGAPVQMSQDQKVTAFLRSESGSVWRGRSGRGAGGICARARRREREGRPGVRAAKLASARGRAPFLHDKARPALVVRPLHLHAFLVRHRRERRRLPWRRGPLLFRRRPSWMRFTPQHRYISTDSISGALKRGARYTQLSSLGTLRKLCMSRVLTHEMRDDKQHKKQTTPQFCCCSCVDDSWQATR